MRSFSALMALLGVITLLPACGPPLVEAPEKLPPFSDLAFRCHKWAQGSFSNERQVKNDTKVPAQMLHQCAIWPSRTDGLWFYSEEVDPKQPLKPLRQVIYRISDDLAGGLLIQGYDMPGNTLIFAGEWRDPKTFNQLDPSNLSMQGGCAIHLDQQSDGVLTGGTQGTDCASTQEGASYQTETFRIGSLDVSIWRRGIDSNGLQVWGTVGPIDYERTNAAVRPESTRPGSGHIQDIGPYTPKRK